MKLETIENEIDQERVFVFVNNANDLAFELLALEDAATKSEKLIDGIIQDAAELGAPEIIGELQAIKAKTEKARKMIGLASETTARRLIEHPLAVSAISECSKIGCVIPECEKLLQKHPKE